MKKTIISVLITVTLVVSAFANMPAIKIYSKSGSSDFARYPVAKHVTEARASWGDIREDPAPYKEECEIVVLDENGVADEIYYAPAKVKVRGNWTTSYDKKPLRLTFDKKTPILGLNNGRKNKDWVLLNVYKDYSYLRDQTALKFAKMMTDGYVSDSKIVEVYINDEFWGVYVLAELQEVCNDRFNITEPKKGYTGIDIGYLLELDGYAYTEKPKHQVWVDYLGPVKDMKKNKVNIATNGYAIDSKINSQEQRDFINNYMNLLWKICYESVNYNKFWKFSDDYTYLEPSNYNNVYDVVSEVIDIDSLINAYILAEVTCDPDLYYSSFFMDVDFGPDGNKKLKFEGPWDFDSALGNKNFCADGKGFHAGMKQYDVNHNDYIHGNPWMLIFVNCDWFQSAVKARWKEIQRTQPLNELLANIDDVTAKYESNFTKDKQRWNHLGRNDLVGYELCQSSEQCTTQKAAAKRLKTWLTARFKFLDSQWSK